MACHDTAATPVAGVPRRTGSAQFSIGTGRPRVATGTGGPRVTAEELAAAGAGAGGYQECSPALPWAAHIPASSVRVVNQPTDLDVMVSPFPSLRHRPAPRWQTGMSVPQRAGPSGSQRTTSYPGSPSLFSTTRVSGCHVDCGERGCASGTGRTNRYPVSSRQINPGQRYPHAAGRTGKRGRLLTGPIVSALRIMRKGWCSVPPGLRLGWTVKERRARLLCRGTGRGCKLREWSYQVYSL
jgi:hypothetical protein